MEENLKLNKQGYEDYLKAIEKKEAELAAVRKYKGTDAIYQGDNWHDNPTLYQTEAQEMNIMKEIAEMKYRLQKAEIVENLGDETLIDIGDVVKADMIMPNNNRRENLFKIVATSPSTDKNAQIKEVSINSPIGAAVYHKKIGDTVTYKVGDRVFTLEIKEKLNLDLEEEKTLTKKR